MIRVVGEELLRIVLYADKEILEYFVVAELYRRGYSVAMTLGNAKATDPFA